MIFTPMASSVFGWPAVVVSLIALLWAAIVAPWRQVFMQSYRQHLFWGAVLGLSLFWQLHVDVLGLFGLHPLLAMSLVMIFGCALGLWVGALALMLGALFQLQFFSSELVQFHFFQVSTSLALQFCLNVLLPGLTAVCVLKAIDRLPIKNLFVYMLGGGFIGAMVTVQAMAVGSWLYVWAFGPAPLLVIVSDHYYLTLLMMFPEGFINGAIMSTLTVLAPHLVKTYDDRRYLDP